MRFESRSRRKHILALRRRLILAAAVLAFFATVLPWGWTAGVHTGDGQVIVVLVAVGIFATLRYRERRVGLMLASEAVLGVIVASTAVVHLAWGSVVLVLRCCCSRGLCGLRAPLCPPTPFAGWRRRLPLLSPRVASGPIVIRASGVPSVASE